MILFLPGGPSEPLGGLVACSPGKILKYRVPEMLSPAFWGETLENSEANNTQTQHTSGLLICTLNQESFLTKPLGTKVSMLTLSR